MTNLEQIYDLTSAYKPVALYFNDADFVEYVREDASCIYNRIDETLTLAIEMDTRLPIGFRIKGFKNLYLKSVKSGAESPSGFVQLVPLLEKIILEAGDRVFNNVDLLRAYRAASDIARSDEVRLQIDAMAA